MRVMTRACFIWCGGWKLSEADVVSVEDFADAFRMAFGVPYVPQVAGCDVFGFRCFCFGRAVSVGLQSFGVNLESVAEGVNGVLGGGVFHNIDTQLNFNSSVNTRIKLFLETQIGGVLVNTPKREPKLGLSYFGIVSKARPI